MVRRKSSYANSSAGSLPRTRPLCTSSWAKSLELGRTYVDNDNQIVELKIPVDVVEKNAVAATERLDSAQVPAHQDSMANNFIRQVSKNVVGTKKILELQSSYKL